MRPFTWLIIGGATLIGAGHAHAAELRGVVVDADGGAPIAARLYIRSDTGQWFFPRSASPDGSAIAFRKQYPAGQGRAAAVEMHTTLSAHPFTVDLPPGAYTVTAERGKEYIAGEEGV